MANYSKKDMTYIVKWFTNEEESEEYTIAVTDAGDKDPEKQWYEIVLKDLGVKPIACSEGVKIEILVKCDSSEREIRRSTYGYDGGQSDYSVLEGQDYDFDTANSDHNDNNTRNNWG